MSGRQDEYITNTVWKIDISNNFKFTKGPSMIDERQYFGCATMSIGSKNIIVVAGPCQVEIFDPSRNEWVPGM